MTAVVEVPQDTRFGREVFRRIRRLMITALATWIVYSTFSGGTKGACFGEILPGADPGNPQACETWRLSPSPLVGLAVACLVIWAVGRLAHGTRTEAEAIRSLDRARLAIMAIVVGSFAIAQVWFWSLPMPSEAGSVLFPFPFGAVSVESTPAG